MTVACGSATRSGLVHIHEGRTDTFASADGLSGDDVSALFEDREGNIWVATTDGLDRFRDVAVPTVSEKQGLSNARVFAVRVAADGSLWMGTATVWRSGTTARSPRTVPASRRPTVDGARQIVVGRISG